MKKYLLTDFPGGERDFTQNDYKDLVTALQHHGHCYYTLDDPKISDGEYDEMYRLLIKVEELHPQWIVPDSPSYKVGGEIKKSFASVSHNPPMMSLDNITDEEQLTEFHERVQKSLQSIEHIFYHAEPKFDGLAIDLIYANGILVSGSTRGDGETGEDITHNIRTVRNIPLKLMMNYPPELISIRGECVMPLEVFDALNKDLESQGKKLFANPRNAAAGSLRQQDSKIAASRDLFFFPYSVGNIVETDLSREKNPGPDFQSEIYKKYFPLLGFQVSPDVKTGTLAEISNHYKNIWERRSQLPYDIDGIVVKVDDIRHWEPLGMTSKYPRYAIAYKFAARSAVTELLDVSFQTGRTGIVTPVALLKPVNVGGVIIRRATLHNMKEIERLKIHIGDSVEVIRAGDVIPKVESVVAHHPKKSQKIRAPENCPECNAQLVIEDIFLRCINRHCRGRKVASLKYFVSRDGLDIDGLGAEWIEKLFDLGKIQDFQDIYTLNEEKLTGIDGMGDILRQNMLRSIADKKKVSLEVFLKSLGIPNVGSHIAEVMAENYQSIEEITAASREELNEIHEIGPVIATSLYEYFHDENNIENIRQLLNSGFTIEKSEKTSQLDLPLKGEIFVFTGTLQNIKREDAQKQVKKFGAKTASTVSGSTTCLVYGEKVGSKLKKADEAGIRKLSEIEFEEFIKKLESGLWKN